MFLMRSVLNMTSHYHNTDTIQQRTPFWNKVEALEIQSDDKILEREQSNKTLAISRAEDAYQGLKRAMVCKTTGVVPFSSV